jgi:hypothetical protein
MEVGFGEEATTDLLGQRAILDVLAYAGHDHLGLL